MAMSNLPRVLVAGAMLPGLAWADTGTAYVTSVEPATLVVKSNGASYTQLATPPSWVVVFARLEYDTGVAGRIESWWIQPKIINGYGIYSEMPGMAAFRQAQHYAIGSRPKSIGLNLVLPVLGNSFADRAVAMCNMKADYLRSQGKSNAWIFSQDRMVSFKVQVDYGVDATGPGSKNPILEGQGEKTITVRCSRFTGPNLPTVGGKLTVPTKVLKATMQVEEIASPSGVCRIDTVTAISANKADATIKYRFVHHSGRKSKVFTTRTKANKIAVVRHQWDIPNGPGMEHGWVRIEGVSPKFKSNKGSYSMNCHGSPGGLSGPRTPSIKGTLRQR